MAAVSPTLDETRAEMERLAESNRALARAETEMDRRLDAGQDLSRDRDEVKGNIDRLVGKARDAEAQMEALTSAIEEGSDRLGALELTMQNSIDRLTGALETQRRS